MNPHDWPLAEKVGQDFDGLAAALAGVLAAPDAAPEAGAVGLALGRTGPHRALVLVELEFSRAWSLVVTSVRFLLASLTSCESVALPSTISFMTCEYATTARRLASDSSVVT